MTAVLPLSLNNQLTGLKLTVKGLDHGLEGFKRNTTVPFGQNIDPQSEQHAGPLWA